MHLIKKTNLFFCILFCITLLSLAGCIVQPEYLAESKNIPNGQKETEKVATSATPSATVEPDFIPQATPIPVAEETDKAITVNNTANPEYHEFGRIGYKYSLLTDSQKEIYLQFDKHLSKYESSFTIICNQTDDLSPAYDALVRDHPEYYYLRGYNRRYFEGSQEIEVSMYYEDGITIEQARLNVEKVDLVVDTLLAQMDKGLSDYEKIIYFYTWIVEHVKYEHGENDQTIVGVFLENKAVCNGYSESFQYLCNRAGIFCTTATGFGINELHAWNLIKLNDQYYWVDVTWGDHTDDEVDEMQGKYNTYAFLCMDDDFLFQSHTLDPDEFYPACTDRTMYYYYKTGDFFEHYNKNEILAYLQERIGSSANARVLIVFEYHEDYLKMLDEGTDLINEVLKTNPNYQRGYTTYSWHSDAGNYILYIVE